VSVTDRPAHAVPLPATRAGVRGVKLNGPVPLSRRRPDRAERRLASRLQAGDPGAVADLYDRFGAATFGFLLGMLGDREAAEDVQQQVFTEVWRSGSRYDPSRAGLLTWVLTIARSRAIDHLRKRVPEPRDPRGMVALAEGSTEAEADVLLDRWRVAGLLARLPDDERALLRMRFFEELSQSEIAAATGIPLGTVKARMVRGLTRLRDLLDAEDAG
jgi:RNA polymerase sigma-70 factor (ECF subfamily)